jgi:phosphate:Na+ symporter
VPALAVMLGANVGTTLIVQILSFHVSRAAPILILAGFLMFRLGRLTRTRDLGRVAIGLGLMLLALHELVDLVKPFEDAPAARMLLSGAAGQPLLDLIVAAALTWAVHSSAAVVLLVMSLAGGGVIPPATAFALVLGANLGTAINPCLEGAPGDGPSARRLPIGNLVNRLLGCAAALAALPVLARWIPALQPDLARAVADFHTLFNIAVAAVSFPLLTPYASLLRRWLPERVEQADPSHPRYLDDRAREMPVIAIGAAAREALRLADVLEAMLGGLRVAIEGGDRKRISETKRMDDILDRLNAAIKAYLTSLDIGAMTEADHRRANEVLAFATNMEHAGDVVARGLLGLAGRRVKRGLSFSHDGEVELVRMLDRLVVNLRAATAVFMTEDERAARRLAVEKETFRDLEATATQAHFTRMREGRPETAETSALHLDIVRDLKRVNAHLVAGAAYPVLEGQGELLASRLRT